MQTVAKRERKVKKERDNERLRETDSDVVEPPRPRERKKHRVAEDSEATEGSKPNPKFKDVTNSQASRTALLQLDTTSGT